MGEGRASLPLYCVYDYTLYKLIKFHFYIRYITLLSSPPQLITLLFQQSFASFLLVFCLLCSCVGALLGTIYATPENSYVRFMISVNDNQWRHWRWCHPVRQLMVSSYLFPTKTDDLFIVIVLWKVMTYRLVTTTSTPSDIVSTVFFVNSATKK